MSDTLDLNQNLDTRLTNKFYVEFQRMPINVSNFLDAQLISVDRPIITFDTIELFDKGMRNRYAAVPRLDPIGLTFHDDVEGLTLNTLTFLVETQAKYNASPFNFKLITLDNKSEVSDSITCMNCFIQTIGSTPLSYSDNSQRIIDINISFDNLDFITNK